MAKALKFNVKAFALACGITWGLFMMLIGWVSASGWGIGMVNAIASLYIGFTPTFLGGIIGGIYGFIDGAIGGAIFAWIYNKLAKK